MQQATNPNREQSQRKQTTFQCQHDKIVWGLAPPATLFFLGDRRTAQHSKLWLRNEIVGGVQRSQGQAEVTARRRWEGGQQLRAMPRGMQMRDEANQKMQRF